MTSLTFKRHYHLIVLLVLVAVGLILGLGNQRIITYTAPGNEQVMEQGVYIAQAEISSLLAALGIH